MGGSLRDVQSLAGHSSLQTTQRYIEGDAAARRRVVDLVWSLALSESGCSPSLRLDALGEISHLTKKSPDLVGSGLVQEQ